MLYEINASAVWRPAKKKVIQHFSVSRLFGKNRKLLGNCWYPNLLDYSRSSKTGFIYNNIYFLLGNLETSTSQEDSRAEAGNTIDMAAVKSCLGFWKTWIVVVVPILSLPIILFLQGPSQDSEEENEVNSILEFVSTHQGIRRKIYGRKMTRCDVNANGGSFTEEMSSERKVVQWPKYKEDQKVSCFF